MMNLEDNRITSLIEAYLEEKIYNYSIMINGDWGSGKTHFVKEVLLPYLGETKNERKPIYISLYGLKESSEISNQLVTAIIESRMEKGRKLLPFINAGVNVFSDIVGGKIGSDAVRDADFNNVYSPFIKYENLFFIFDDLERCSMPINEVLGYINHFLEQYDAKVLILANEKEIGTVEIAANDYTKYLVATDDSIIWPAEEGKSYLRSRNGDVKIDVSEIKRRLDFLTKENILYLRIKEKLVGQTIYYQPKLRDVIPKIFDKCIQDELICEDSRKILLAKACEIMEDENCYNLRTLQFSLAFFLKLCKDNFEDGNNPRQCDTAKLTVMEAILRVAIYKKNDEKNINGVKTANMG